MMCSPVCGHIQCFFQCCCFFFVFLYFNNRYWFNTNKQKKFHNANQLLQPTNLTNGSLNVNWQCTADGDLSREHSEKKGGPGCPSGSLVSCCSQHMAHSLSFSLTAQRQEAMSYQRVLTWNVHSFLFESVFFFCFFFNWVSQSFPTFLSLLPIKCSSSTPSLTLNQTYVSLNCTGYHLAIMIKMAIITITHF